MFKHLVMSTAAVLMLHAVGLQAAENKVAKRVIQPEKSAIILLVDDENKVISITTPAEETTYNYNENGQLEKVDRTNGASATYNYDRRGEFDSISYTNGTIYSAKEVAEIESMAKPDVVLEAKKSAPKKAGKVSPMFGCGIFEDQFVVDGGCSGGWGGGGFEIGGGGFGGFSGAGGGGGISWPHAPQNKAECIWRGAQAWRAIDATLCKYVKDKAICDANNLKLYREEVTYCNAIFP